MDFKTGQALVLAGVTPEALRHWKQVLPPLKRRDGRRASFTFGEVAALTVLGRIVRDLGVSVSCLADDSEALFEAAERAANASSGPLYLFWAPGVVVLGSLRDTPECDLTTLIRIDQIVEHLHSDIAAQPTPQPSLF